MKKPILILFLVTILFSFATVYAVDDQLYSPCGGDGQLFIACFGDVEINPPVTVVFDDEGTPEGEEAPSFSLQIIIIFLIIFIFLFCLFFLIIWKKRKKKRNDGN